MSDVRVAALVTIISLLGFSGAFIALGRLFDYPDILRRPTSEILERFLAGGARLHAVWYLFMASGLVFMLVPLLFHPVLEARGVRFAIVATALGFAAGFVQVLGLLRWSFLVPYLAQEHARSSDPVERRLVELEFQSAHRFVGGGVGEHLGYLFTGAWTVAMAAFLPRAGLVAPVVGWIGIVPAVAILIGLLEPLDVRWAGFVNALGYLAFSAWLFAVAVILLVAPPTLV
jgi:hypothetical protein